MTKASEVREAFDLVTTFLSEVTGKDELQDICLEEFETVGGRWRITVGFRRATYPQLTVGVPMGEIKDYRVFEINPSTKSVLSMKMRS